MASDKATGKATESATVDVIDGAATNPTPAIEEGPHLNDPDIRRMKREQLKAAGVKLSDPGLTEDMKTILREKE